MYFGSTPLRSIVAVPFRVVCEEGQTAKAKRMVR